MLEQSDANVSKLKSIQNYIQNVADAFAAVLDFEVAIVDEHLEVIAGTGKYKDQIGIVYGSESFNYQLLHTQKSYLVSEPTKCNTCQQCDLNGTCKVLAGLLYPIKIDGNTIGSISLYAFKETQRAKLLRDLPKLGDFLEKIGDLIGGKLNEIALNTKLTKMVYQFNTLIDSMRQGIIAIDYNGIVTHINHSAINILAIKADQTIGSKIENIFAEFKINELRKMTEPYLEKDVFYKTSEHVLHFISTTTAVKDGTMVDGFVISFRGISDIRKLAGHVIREERKYSLDGILGASKSIIELKQKMRMVAPTDSTILITGESGTGKELFARAIHQESLRKDAAFIAINCGAIPDNLLESELFGYDEGAFTGARRSGKPGKFEMANGGTLFLDEIGDMPLHLQVKLLRVLQDFTIERVGGVKSKVVDVRIVAATNRNLEEMIWAKQFRSDLYYRLSVIPFFIPPLRERKEDLVLLINFFLGKYNLIFGKDIKGFAQDALARICEYTWPGNVRELENAIEYSANICPDSLINVSYLPNRIAECPPAVAPMNYQQQIQSIADLERNALVEALNAFGSGSRAIEKAALSLGMSRSTLYRKIKELGLQH